VQGKPGRVVVTGGAGFIGSHVADAFLADGAKVLVIDDLSSGREENVPAAAELQPVDIVDAQQLRKAIEGFAPDVVCHLAAQASVTVSVERPEHDLEVNVRGTLNVLEATRAAETFVVFASTGGAIYGDEAPIPTPETADRHPVSPYGTSKLAAEEYVATWSRLHGMPNVTLRLGNVYGPRQEPHGEAGVVAIFSDHLLREAAPTVYGNGEQSRDYVHVSDVVDAFRAAASSGAPGLFNVGTGIETSVNRLLDILQSAAGTALEPRFEPLRSGELIRSALDAGRLRGELGWLPRVPAEEGLAATLGEYAAAAS
jgi:UDP-glucose 4-epimerase